MKEKIGYGIGILFFIVFVVVYLMQSCSDQGIARNWGGTYDVELEPNDKLIEVTWKDDELWILTKKMTDTDVPEEYRFYEKSPLGIIEGEVILKETKLSEEELTYLKEQKTLAEDYNNYSNWKNDNFGNYDSEGENVIYIRYNEDTGTYEKIKEYTYAEDGSLIAK